MLVHEEEKCFSLHIKHFLLCSNDKDIPTLKTMATYFYCFCIVSRPVTRILCGGGANEAKADPTTEMYFLSSDPFI